MEDSRNRLGDSPTAPPASSANAQLSTSVPPGWPNVPGLVFGFGRRGDAAPEGAVQVRQVHGADVVDADDPSLTFATSANRSAQPVDFSLAVAADAISVGRPGVFGAVRTADCVPVLMFATTITGEPRWAAAVHAGWRGTIAGVVDAAVAHAFAHGRAAGPSIEPGDIFAALGPSIGPCCYEVSAEVAAGFRDAGYPAGEPTGAKPRLDLRRINRFRLLACGLTPEKISLVGPCTRCHPDLYHSYRRDPRDPGRQLSWIGWEDRSVDTDLRGSR